MSYVIFSIDFHQNPAIMNGFRNYICYCKHSNAVRGECLPIIGKYNGETENAFIMRADDYDRAVANTPWLDGQESILRVASGNKMETWLEYLDNRADVHLGCMHEVCEEEALQADAFSYRPDMGTYWIAKQGNPDGSYARSVAEFRASKEITDAPAVSVAA